MIPLSLCLVGGDQIVIRFRPDSWIGIGMRSGFVRQFLSVGSHHGMPRYNHRCLTFKPVSTCLLFTVIPPFLGSDLKVIVAATRHGPRQRAAWAGTQELRYLKLETFLLGLGRMHLDVKGPSVVPPPSTTFH